MVPGPIEFEPAVLAAMAEPTTSHVAADFIEVFGQALERTRRVFLSQDGQPFVVAGSGTLAMDMAGANLVEPGDRVLVVNTGYFGDRFGALLERYGAVVAHLRAPVGSRPSLEAIEAELSREDYKLVTVTQVDTSTGVLADVAGVARLARQHGALCVVDGVCSVAGEELRMSAWGVDVAFSASQKAIGVPPGLALLVAGPRALAAFRARVTPVSNYYADWSHWLPIMEAYEARRPAYFGTPPVNLVAALNVSLGRILDEGMEERFGRHRVLAAACRAGIKALRLTQVPRADNFAAHTMTAPRYPESISAANFLSFAHEAGVILAGGLHPDIRNQYFRIGHMGPNTVGDVLATIGAVETGLARAGYRLERGVGLAAAARAAAEE
ncbi:MAG: alanine--glyoxylate aminotransferase family protein [Anaerolineae bacterium]|nr:alanine--glyoxylate aminotransferase family protein [Anaerolineae bacterium]